MGHQRVQNTLYHVPWAGLQSESEGNRDTGIPKSQGIWAGKVPLPLTGHGSLARLLEVCTEFQSPYLENGHTLCVLGRRVTGSPVIHLISSSNNSCT